MEFLKMEALGNDFIVIEGSTPDTGQVRAWCDRRRGIAPGGCHSQEQQDRSWQGPVRIVVWTLFPGQCGHGLKPAQRLR